MFYVTNSLQPTKLWMMLSYNILWRTSFKWTVFQKNVTLSTTFCYVL